MNSRLADKSAAQLWGIWQNFFYYHPVYALGWFHILGTCIGNAVSKSIVRQTLAGLVFRILNYRTLVVIFDLQCLLLSCLYWTQRVVWSVFLRPETYLVGFSQDPLESLDKTLVWIFWRDISDNDQIMVLSGTQCRPISWGIVILYWCPCYWLKSGTIFLWH